MWLNLIFTLILTGLTAYGPDVSTKDKMVLASYLQPIENPSRGGANRNLKQGTFDVVKNN